jgi:hypothetical protein
MQIPYPLSIPINQSHQSHYFKIFQLLFQVQQLKYFYLPKILEINQENKLSQHLRGLVSRLYIKSFNLVENLEFYFHQGVIEKENGRFDDQMRKVNGLDEIVNCHD